MGFLKKYLSAIFLVIAIQGCSISILNIPVNVNGDKYPMFGKNSERNFFAPVTVSDSLQLVWENNTSGSFENSSVTISDSIVFVGDFSGRVYAFSFYDGKEIGKLKDKGAVYTAPVVYNSWIIYAVSLLDENESTLYLYSYTDGKVFREINVKGRVLTEIAATDDGFVITTEQGEIQKYDLYGLLLWKTSLDAYTHSSPAISEGKIIVGDDKGNITAIDSHSGKIIYKEKIGGLFLSGGSIKNGNIYFGNDNGKIYSLDIKSGEINWSFNSGARILMTPAADDNNLFVGNLNGDLFCLNLEKGNEIWKFYSGGIFNATPLITNNYLFVPDLNRELHIVNKANGSLQKTMHLEGRAKFTPVLFRNILLIGFDRGMIQAYEFKY